MYRALATHADSSRPDPYLFVTATDLPGPLQDGENVPLLKRPSAPRAKPLRSLSARLGSLWNGIMLWGKKGAF